MARRNFFTEYTTRAAMMYLSVGVFYDVYGSRRRVALVCVIFGAQSGDRMAWIFEMFFGRLLARIPKKSRRYFPR